MAARKKAHAERDKAISRACVQLALMDPPPQHSVLRFSVTMLGHLATNAESAAAKRQERRRLPKLPADAEAWLRRQLDSLGGGA